MARVSNYDDLAGFKTPTQRKIEGQVAQLLADMKRIDATVATGDSRNLKLSMWNWMVHIKTALKTGVRACITTSRAWILPTNI